MIGDVPMRLLEALIVYHAANAPVPEHHVDDVACLAQNIWHEARGSTSRDQLAVAHVVLNRVESRAYPNDVCDVIWQPHQFSWTNDGLSDKVKFHNPRARKVWEDIVVIAIGAIEGELSDITSGSTHFHNRRVEPNWADEFVLVARFGDHLYYRDGYRPSRRPGDPT